MALRTSILTGFQLLREWYTAYEKFLNVQRTKLVSWKHELTDTHYDYEHAHKDGCKNMHEKTL